MAKVQYIHDIAGNPQFVVLPVAEYEALVDNSDSSDAWEDIPYTPDEFDDVAIPGDVINIMVGQDVSLLAAWRIYRGLSQYEVADELGTTQSAVSQFESVDSTPQKRTRKRLAALYDCLPEQLTL